jgi:tetraacyldisaccharide 4'-kinase
MIEDKRRERALYQIVSGEHGGAAVSLARLGLAGAAAAYYLGWRMRTRRLERRQKDRLGVPAISVGNITLGGTGKTPVCRYLARELSARGRKVGIATRGYGREGAGTVILDGNFDPRSWHLSGDEPLLLAKDPAVAAVAIDANRTRAARALTTRIGCDIVILDDGFQFVTLERDFDIVVIDAGNPFGFERLFPAGLLREPLSGLGRADLFWIAKGESADEEKKAAIRERLGREFPGIPVVESCYEPAAFTDLDSPGIRIPIEAMKGAKLLCMSGIGNPESFEKAIVRVTGGERLAFRFTDHHPFGEGELMRVEDVALKRGADFIVTTEKDAVRLPGHFKPKRRWLVFHADVAVTAGSEALEPIFAL